MARRFLQTLLRIALVENYDLRIAAARVLDARSQVIATRSFQFPDVSANASAPYERTSGDRAPMQFEETFSPLGTLDLSWEIDFWGRLRRATEAARADLLAAETDDAGVVTAKRLKWGVEPVLREPRLAALLGPAAPERPVELDHRDELRA